jgi:ankyrin repeat protein
VVNGKQDIVRYLVERGADVNAYGGEHGYALQAAAYQEREGMIRYMVEQGADVNAQGGYFGNALQAAVYTGNYDIVRLLVERGANVKLRAANTAMHFMQLCVAGMDL